MKTLPERLALAFFRVADLLERSESILLPELRELSKELSVIQVPGQIRDTKGMITSG
jgi:hypothetical protein